MLKNPNKTIVSELASKSDTQRKHAVKRLRNIPEDVDYEDAEFIANPRSLRKHIPKLVQLLETHPSLEVRTWCAQYLGDLSQPTKGTVDALRMTVRKCKDAHLLATCVCALGRYGTEAAAAVPDLVRLANKSDGHMREQAAFAIEKIGHVPSCHVKLLVKLLDAP